MGGTQRQIGILVKGLVSRGFQCKVWVVDEKPGPFTDEVRSCGATIQGIFTGIGPLGTFARLIYRLLALPAVVLAFRLKRERPQVLQCFHDEINVVGALAGRLAGVPKVVLGLRSVHPRDDSWAVEGHWRDPYDLVDPRSVDALIVNSQAGRETFLRFEPGFPPEKVHVVRNCVIPAAASGEVPLTASSGRPIVLWMARVSPEKRPDLFVALLARLKRAQVPFEAWVAGEGRELAVMKSLALDAGVSDDVKFLGCVPRVGDLLAAAAVLVVCSDVEGLPNSVLEAQLAGCPVVATAVGGVPELIADGMTGFLVRRGDVEALAARVSAVLSDRPLSQKLVSAAREHVAQYLSQDRMIGEVLAIYDLATNAEPSTHPDPSCP